MLRNFDFLERTIGLNLENNFQEVQNRISSKILSTIASSLFLVRWDPRYTGPIGFLCSSRKFRHQPFYLIASNRKVIQLKHVISKSSQAQHMFWVHVHVGGVLSANRWACNMQGCVQAGGLAVGSECKVVQLLVYSFKCKLVGLQLLYDLCYPSPNIINLTTIILNLLF